MLASAHPHSIIPNALNDKEVVLMVLAGQTDAFALLMRRHNRKLFRTVRSILKDDAEAEEVLQEVYLQAFRKLDQFHGDATLTTWLTRIAINEAIMRQRKSVRRAEVIQLGADSDPYWQEAHQADPDMQSGSPEKALMRTEMRRVLEREIDSLPDAFRTVFVLRAIEEVPTEEIAMLLDIPEATVRTRYFRARSMLREALAREIDFATEEAFSFDGERCNRIVDRVMARLPDMLKTM